MTSFAHLENKKIAALRRLWNGQDLIGVVSSTEDDEYNGYIEPTFQLLQQNATADEISRYIKYVVGEYMGMGEEAINRANPTEFTSRLQAWYSTHGNMYDDF